MKFMICFLLVDLKETSRLVEIEGGYCQIYQVDVTDNEAVYRTSEEVLQEHGKVYLNLERFFRKYY